MLDRSESLSMFFWDASDLLLKVACALLVVPPALSVNEEGLVVAPGESVGILRAAILEEIEYIVLLGVAE